MIGNERLHQGMNDNGVRAVKFTTSKNLVVKSMMFLHQNNHKYTSTFPDGKTHNLTDHVLRIGAEIQVYLMYNLSQGLTVIVITIWWLKK
jgi:hypothetical protein